MLLLILPIVVGQAVNVGGEQMYLVFPRMSFQAGITPWRPWVMVCSTT
jgi:hypothetical protein